MGIDQAPRVWNALSFNRFFSDLENVEMNDSQHRSELLSNKLGVVSTLWCAIWRLLLGNLRVVWSVLEGERLVS